MEKAPKVGIDNRQQENPDINSANPIKGLVDKFLPNLSGNRARNLTAAAVFALNSLVSPVVHADKIPTDESMELTDRVPAKKKSEIENPPTKKINPTIIKDGDFEVGDIVFHDYNGRSAEWRVLWIDQESGDKFLRGEGPQNKDKLLTIDRQDNVINGDGEITEKGDGPNGDLKTATLATKDNREPAKKRILQIERGEMGPRDPNFYSPNVVDLNKEDPHSFNSTIDKNPKQPINTPAKRKRDATRKKLLESWGAFINNTAQEMLQRFIDGPVKAYHPSNAKTSREAHTRAYPKIFGLKPNMDKFVLEDWTVATVLIQNGFAQVYLEPGTSIETIEVTEANKHVFENEKDGLGKDWRKYIINMNGKNYIMFNEECRNLILIMVEICDENFKYNRNKSEPNKLIKIPIKK